MRTSLSIIPCLLALSLVAGCAKSFGKYTAHSYDRVSEYEYIVVEGQLDTTRMSLFNSKNINRDMEYSGYVEESLSKYFKWKGFKIIEPDDAEDLAGSKILVCRYTGAWNSKIPGLTSEMYISLSLLDYEEENRLFSAVGQSMGSSAKDDVDMAVGELTQDITEYMTKAKVYGGTNYAIKSASTALTAAEVRPPISIDRSVRRVALVIGNGAYPHSPLSNPVQDASDVAASLQQLGFEVIHKSNVGEREMERAISQLHVSLQGGGVGLFYYAGHGIQVDGKNYLVPTDATIDSESDVKYECINAERVLGKMEDAGNSLNIVILDACRNNPFARSFRSGTRGLVRMDAPVGAILAYSTAPGDVAADGSGGNGVYTKHLLRHMMTPGLDINSVFIRTRTDVIKETHGKQIPWESSSLTGLFYFAGQETTQAK